MTNIDELRIVLVGKTGVGKSSTGNTILGRKLFRSKTAAASVTKLCDKAKAEVNGQLISVIDTPGLFAIDVPKKDLVKEIKNCMDFSAPGPHVFLIVISIEKFKREDKESVTIIQTMFGKEANNYSMVLFTHGDQLEDQSIDGYVLDSDYLKCIVDQCKGGCHVFNNKDEDPSQVTNLLEKIKKMVEMNGGSHYTNEMFQKAEKLNCYINTAFPVIMGGIGAAVGTLGGPVGAAAGGAVGSAAGRAVNNVSDNCSIQ